MKVAASPTVNGVASGIAAGATLAVGPCLPARGGVADSREGMRKKSKLHHFIPKHSGDPSVGATLSVGLLRRAT